MTRDTITTANLKFLASDCGSSASGLNETNDCTVRAVAALYSTDYRTAHGLLARLGRKPRQGFYLATVLKDLGLTEWPVYRYWDWGTVAECLPRGVPLIIQVARHVFAVVNNTVVDWQEQARNRIVHAVYAVEARCGDCRHTLPSYRSWRTRR